VVENPTEPSRVQHAAPPAPVVLEPAAEPQEPALERLQAKLDELDIPDDIYRIGGPAERGWSVEEVGSGWRVGWYDGELANPAVFGDAQDAAAFMLGKLLLLPDGGTEEAPQEEAEPAEEAPRASVMTTLSSEQATGSTPSHALQPEPAADTPQPEPVRGGGGEFNERDLEGATMAAPPSRNFVPQQQQTQHAPPPLPPRREPLPPAPTIAAPLPSGPIPVGSAPPIPAPSAPPIPAPSAPPLRRAEPVRPAAKAEQRPGSGNQQWPIYPMAGEPPLTLFRGKELRELPAGSELDRFGGSSGNLTYAAGTPFEERSLVPEWANRPYHVYRVQRPIESLAGVAIPWFEQPGGGAAYLLPASIEELVAKGDLLELDPGEPPID
jgi:hypothetical protein